jgi:uncharacterized protein
LTAKLAPPAAEEPEEPAEPAEQRTSRADSRPPQGGFADAASGLFGAVLGSFARNAGSSLGRKISRDLFGTPPRRRRRTRRR